MQADVSSMSHRTRVVRRGIRAGGHNLGIEAEASPPIDFSRRQSLAELVASTSFRPHFVCSAKPMRAVVGPAAWGLSF